MGKCGMGIAAPHQSLQDWRLGVRSSDAINPFYCWQLPITVPTYFSTFLHQYVFISTRSFPMIFYPK